MILLVEDDPAVREVVEHALRREGMEVVAVGDGEEALEHLKTAEPYKLVVLDLTLGGELDGYSVCQEIRAGSAGEENKTLPVVMLTARDDETSVVVGLEVGADDYVSKPFAVRELVARVRAHLRRRRLNSRNDEEQHKLTFPGLEVDVLKRRVFSGGSPVELTAKEFEVLVLLASSPGRVYSRKQIMRHLWEDDFYGEARAVDIHVQHIRKKIEPDLKNPRYVLTVRGMGYAFANTWPERGGRDALRLADN